MKKIVFIFRICVAISVALVFSGCAGGGGGDGSGSQGRPNTGFRVIHAAIDTAPLDVFSSTKEGASLGIASFAKSSPYFSVPTGALTLGLSRATITSDVVFNREISFNPGDVFSILVYGNRGALGERLSIIADTPPALSSGNSGFRIVHAAGGAANVAASIGGVLIGESIEYGQASEYREIPPGESRLRVRRVTDGALILTSVLNLEADRIYTYIVAGEIGSFVHGELLNDS